MEPERRTLFQQQLVNVLIVLLVAQLGVVSSQILRLGHCPSFSALKDFEMEQVNWIKKCISSKCSSSWVIF